MCMVKIPPLNPRKAALQLSDQAVEVSGEKIPSAVVKFLPSQVAWLLHRNASSDIAGNCTQKSLNMSFASTATLPGPKIVPEAWPTHRSLATIPLLHRRPIRLSAPLSNYQAARLSFPLAELKSYTDFALHTANLLAVLWLEAPVSPAESQPHAAASGPSRDHEGGISSFSHLAAATTPWGGGSGVAAQCLAESVREAKRFRKD